MKRIGWPCLLGFVIIVACACTPKSSAEEVNSVPPSNELELAAEDTEVRLLEHGALIHTWSRLSAAERNLVETIITDALSKSATMPAIDIRAIERCYLLLISAKEQAFGEYYVFENGDKAAVQLGTDGGYTSIDKALYKHLEEAFPVTVSEDDPTAFQFSAQEVAAAKAVVETYFKALEARDDAAVLATLTERHDAPRVVLYGAETRTLTAMEYHENDPMVEGYLRNGRGQLEGVSSQNVIVLRVSFTVSIPAGAASAFEAGTYQDWSMILVRADEQAAWLIDDQGY